MYLAIRQMQANPGSAWYSLERSEIDAALMQRTAERPSPGRAKSAESPGAATTSSLDVGPDEKFRCREARNFAADQVPEQPSSMILELWHAR